MTLRNDRVADTLERETQTIIASWLSMVNAEPDIITFSLTAEERCAHFAKDVC
jgi:hypothetical protein